ncbi:MAG: hypothetical protein A2Z14_12450 [Chloroflexi bacterium RBG_16_48_8]|nr:MAG: hypothetical protein A2Z14_12450 [Chloroflexi bacterium RBG_16_48_8]
MEEFEDWRMANTTEETPVIEVPIPSEQSPVYLCQAWDDLYMHKPGHGENSIEILIHEAHGWPTGPSVNQVVLNSVTIQQGQENPELLLIENLEVGHPPEGNVLLPVNVTSFITSIPIQRQLVFCYDDYCDSAYRGSYVTAAFDGTLDGVYSLEAEIYFPEYSKTCTLGKPPKVF